MLRNTLHIGFIQTIVENAVAWGDQDPIVMSKVSEERVWAEIKKGFVDLLNGYKRPQLIVIPELSVPHGYEYELRKLSASSGAVVIAGLDFVHIREKACNRAMIIVPSQWPDAQRTACATSVFYFGKAFYSAEEIKLFGEHRLISHPDIYVVDAGDYGVLGLAICSDFFDIERFVVYKGRIQHLIIIAHNQDTESYYFLAEAISRLVYCNVIICNTGEHGDSIAFSPFKDNWKRIVYRHKGKDLFSSQVVELPVAPLEAEQRARPKSPLFKSRPPGYRKIDF